MERVVWSMGMNSPEELEDLGKRLSLLQQPKPPKNFKEIKEAGSLIFDLLKAKPDLDLFPPCHQNIVMEKDLNLKITD